ncbi:High-affinity gluconate transporter GntT [Salmonella enterica subsp. arizonae]|uniref:High-affinity gluconate transporter GntT n=1 Tax=Salmonella enterica subsp. arizonae TaxID=59203 RepID=A0A379TQU2_SALER|nr:High-affinity gluconate transporter GntT [Salmonella enterica subsp. arizonae]
MPLVIVAIGVILLLLLMIRFKMNGFIALVLVALAVGLMQGMPLDKVIGSIKTGRRRYAWQPGPDYGVWRHAGQNACRLVAALNELPRP